MAVLEGFGLREVTWGEIDASLGRDLVASPADAQGRGLLLTVEQDGEAADLTDASLYLLWRHRATGERGAEPFEEVDASAGQFSVYYPTAMACAEGGVDAQVMVSRGDDTFVSSRVFGVRVEPALTGGCESEDELTLLQQAVCAYEDALAALGSSDTDSDSDSTSTAELTATSPLSYEDGVLSIDLADYATVEYVEELLGVIENGSY